MSAPRTPEEAEAVAREVVKQRSAFGPAVEKVFPHCAHCFQGCRTAHRTPCLTPYCGRDRAEQGEAENR